MPMTVIGHREWLTPVEKAAELRVSVKTVRRHWEDLGGFRVGHQLRFDKDFPRAGTVRVDNGAHDPATKRTHR